MESLRLLRRPCLIEEDNGLAYLADLEAGYLGSNNWQNHKQNGFFSRFLSYTRNCSDNISIISSPKFTSSPVSSSSSSSRSTTPKLYETRFEQHQPHFLDTCFLCKKPLMSNEDIFMYRGDTPFCSVECRYKQIVIDDVNEKKLQVKALRKKDQRKSSSTNTTKAHGYIFHTSSTIAAA